MTTKPPQDASCREVNADGVRCCRDYGHKTMHDFVSMQPSPPPACLHPHDENCPCRECGGWKPSPPAAPERMTDKRLEELRLGGWATEELFAEARRAREAELFFSAEVNAELERKDAEIAALREKLQRTEEREEILKNDLLETLTTDLALADAIAEIAALREEKRLTLWAANIFREDAEKAEADAKALRETIEKAPHDEDCFGPTDCDCWKATALGKAGRGK